MTRWPPYGMPLTTPMRCARCLLVLPSGDLPPPPALAVYPLPKGWELVVTPVGQDDSLLCAECVRDIARGSPEVLG